MNKLLMIVLMASAAVAFPGCRSHHHNKSQRHPTQHAVRPHHKAPPPAAHKAPPPAAHKKAPPPPVGPRKAPASARRAPAPNGKVPPPKR